MPGTRSGDVKTFPARVEFGYTYGGDGDGGMKIRVLDESSRAVVFEFTVPIEEWGPAVRGSADIAATARLWEGSLDRIGKVYEHREIVVPTIRDSRDYDRADELAQAWLDETRPGWREAGWAVSIPRGDGSTPTNGWNGHRRTADGYKLTLWRYVDPEKTTTTTVGAEFPLDDAGQPLAWPDPTNPTSYVDAWNGWYPERESALAESADWSARVEDRVLAYGAPLRSDDDRYCDWCDSTEHWATDCDQRPVDTDSIPAPDPDVVLAETTIVDVARLYGVTPQTVMRWARKAATEAKTEVPS